MTFTSYVSCDPLRSGQISAQDQLLPFYVMDKFGHIPFMTGIFVAGIFAASLGWVNQTKLEFYQSSHIKMYCRTVASALNSLSAVTIEDLLIAGFNTKISPEKGAELAKWMSLGYVFPIFFARFNYSDKADLCFCLIYSYCFVFLSHQFHSSVFLFYAKIYAY